MTLFEAISSSLQPRSATSAALQERLAAAPVQASAAKPVETQTRAAVQHPSAMESARMMMESRSNAAQKHVPMQGRTTLSAGSMTAAYLTEMRLSQELAAVQEKLAK